MARDEPVRTIKLPDGKEVRIFHDSDPMNPRVDFENAGTMVCFHTRYRLGDPGHGLTSDAFNGWEEMGRSFKARVLLPVYMYDHSGLTISTTPYSCHWDSGQIGWIYMTAQQIQEEWGSAGSDNVAKARACLEAEVNTYCQYLEGDVYGFVVGRPHTCGECGDASFIEEESCWGFFGHDPKENGMIDHIPELSRVL